MKLIDVVIGQAESTHQNRAFNRRQQAGNEQCIICPALLNSHKRVRIAPKG